MPVRIEDVQMAKSQRSYRVRLGSEWYGAYLKYKPDQQPILSAIGRMVEVETATLEKGGPWITAWTYSADQTAPAGARPITLHQGAAQSRATTDGSEGAAHRGPSEQAEPARQLSAEELKVVNGIVMAMVEHIFPKHSFQGIDEAIEYSQLAMKAIAQTVREL